MCLKIVRSRGFHVQRPKSHSLSGGDNSELLPKSAINHGRLNVAVTDILTHIVIFLVLSDALLFASRGAFPDTQFGRSRARITRGRRRKTSQLATSPRSVIKAARYRHTIAIIKFVRIIGVNALSSPWDGNP